jgi:hypothetical protein
MKLKVNLITGGKYFKAGEDIPDDELPEFATKYAMEAEPNGDAVDDSYAETLQKQRADLDHTAKPKVVKREGQMKGKSFVKRNDRFVLASAVEALIPGEILYWHRPRAFGVTEKWIAYSRVRSEAESL